MFSVPALLLQESTSLWNAISPSKPIPFVVFLLLVGASIFSWTIVFAKWSRLRKAQGDNEQFLQAFRKANGWEAVMAACERFSGAPVVKVFDFGYKEWERQTRRKGHVTSRESVERNLQVGISEEVDRLEEQMPWLATIATVTPFVGLFGTVWGIIDAFQALTAAGSASLRAVGPGIAEALVATAMGLAAAIPAAIFYNYFGNSIRRIGGRMEDFSLEFLNLIERVQEN